jgi:DNA-binding transcriptional LysR family regulator
MEIHEIRYFLALCETLNFTRAAEACNVTQPALTRAIKGLEDKLGGPLIHRERGNTHLTELGRIMQPHFRDMAERLTEARRVARDHARMQSAVLRLGLMCTIGPKPLVDLVGGFVAANPGVELEMHDAPAATIEDDLIRGALDLAIYCRPEAEPDALHRLPLFAERLMVAVSPSHPLARLNAVRLQDLAGQCYVQRSNCEYDGTLDEALRARGVEVRTLYRSERDDWVQAMVMAGIGFTFIPEYAVTLSGLAARPLIDPEITRKPALVTMRGRPHSPAVGAFLRSCRLYPWADRLRAGTKGAIAA